MKPTPDLLEAGVQAFAQQSAAPADGRATRARVLATAGARLQRRATGRRLALGALIALGAALSGSAAWTAVGHWRAASPLELTDVTTPKLLERSRLPREAIAANAEPAPAPSVSLTPTLDAESRAYQRAHEAHFGADEPRAALAAWNRYLAAYPRGTFAPEARYNRALCLLRLGHKEAGVAALRPFARGSYGDYRRREATTLIDWLAPAAP